MSIYTMSNIKDFAELVAAKVKEAIGGVDTEVIEVSKNNAVLTSISIRPEGSCVAPNVYIDDMYKAYRNRKTTVQEVIDYIVDVYRKEGTPDFDINKMNSLDYVESHIYPRLVKGAPNPLLEGKVVTSFMDMAVVYVVEVGRFGERTGTVNVTEDLLRIWGVTKSYLHELALSNLRRRPLELIHMDKILEESLRVQCREMGMPEEMIDAFVAAQLEGAGSTPMWVVANAERYYGAAYLLLDEFRDAIEKIGGDAYVIPSSVHELIIVPVDSIGTEELAQMIPEVNSADFYEDTDMLSNTLYRYSLADGLRVALKEVVA